MRLHQLLGMFLLLTVCGACVSLNPSASDVTGRWQVECEGGKETLDLKPDGRYVYLVESPRRQLKVEGAWKIDPPRGSGSARIVLQNGPQSCENAPFFKGESGNALYPVWEWGQTELSFHPDLGGFRRIKSSR